MGWTYMDIEMITMVKKINRLTSLELTPFYLTIGTEGLIKAREVLCS